ncbi:ABC-three component system middle component 6 [Gluconobacter sp. P5B12]|uniref:ABC-three component system middle component 6 n=1 Tax=unclassified Gluconobacter TaxID=2644261 RepID=UPI001C04AE8D|nr:ABC-three component system middle component 6 [Gluconobacter sp. P5B12]
MILPTKNLQPDRALLTIGGEILAALDERSSVSSVWETVRSRRAERENASPLPFDWFVLALSLLYAIRAIDLDGDLLSRRLAA